MSEQNNESLYKKQKELKPKAEDVAAKLIDGNNLKNLMNFLEFLKDNKLTPRWQSSNSWKVTYKNKSVCYVNLNDREKFWMIRHSQFTRDQWFKDYDEYIENNELKEFVLGHINAPICVGRGCKGRENMTILGKHFDSVCNCWPLTVKNADGAILENSKKLVLTIKNFIADLN